VSSPILDFSEMFIFGICKRYLGTCPKYDVICLWCFRVRVKVRVRVRIRVEVKVRVTGNLFKIVFGQTSIWAGVLDPL